MYRRLLVPLDGSHLAETILVAVERLAAAYGATVVLLHVIERGAPATVHGERHLRTGAEAQTYLEGLAARLSAGGIVVETHAHDVPEGDIARSIVAHAEEGGADLIALCTHGGGGLRDLLVGSIAQQVLRRGTTPVLLTRPDPSGGAAHPVPSGHASPAGPERPFAPRTVLVPLDGTAAAEVALATAQDVAGHVGAALHLVMVVATLGTVRGERQALAQALPMATRAELDLEGEDARRYLDGVADRLRAGGTVVTAEVRRGDTLSALAAEASKAGVGLVVMATHGRAGVQAIWAGSVATRLLARTRVPVLLLRMIESEDRSAP
ncbi:MAG TPA: universal stress protein [Chloroflexota bacterium]|nr:universal stress protein [Chloroflexota bacterium]